MATKKKTVGRKKVVHRRVTRTNQNPFEPILQQEILSALETFKREETKRTKHLADIASALQTISMYVADVAMRDRVTRMLAAHAGPSGNGIDNAV